MKPLKALNFEQEIRNAVELGNPWALDELLEEVCAENNELRRIVMAIVAIIVLMLSTHIV